MTGLKNQQSQLPTPSLDVSTSIHPASKPGLAGSDDHLLVKFVLHSNAGSSSSPFPGNNSSSWTRTV
jgi:hypothetical protein